jgi:hypothetical protein
MVFVKNQAAVSSRTAPRLSASAALAAMGAFVALVAAAGAHASPLCVDGTDDASDDLPAALASGANGANANAADRVAEEARVILPCAVADTGNGCADASIYVLTTGGVLLCQIDIPALAAGGQALPEVEQIPGTPPPSSSGTAAVAGLPPAGAVLPPVLVRDALRAPADECGTASDGYTRLSTPPS